MAVEGTITRNENGTVRFTTAGTCPACGLPAAADQLDPEAVAAWQAGMYAQDAFPHLSAGEREVLISGTHARCFEELFGDEEDADESLCDPDALEEYIPGAQDEGWAAYWAAKPKFRDGE